MSADDDWIARRRSAWRHRGRDRPPFAVEPGPGQESVWDYPRPPRIEPDARRVLVRHGERVLADSSRCLRVLETASPPTFYVPPDDVARELLAPADGSSFCEWKGAARYWSLRAAPSAAPVAWTYDDPLPEFSALRGHFAFYPARLECRVGGQRAEPQPGGFYGGWVTPDVVGPFKGEPSSAGW